MPSKPLRVLIAEDNPADVELITRGLVKAGFVIEPVVVDTEEGFLDALTKPLDIVLSDFEMPNFSGLRALALLRRSGLKIPFIIVSGSIGEDVAVAAMREGANDYILKDRMARLGTAVEQALEQYRLQVRGDRAAKALRESEERFREVVETINEVFWVTEGWGGNLLYVSPGYDRIWGGPRQKLYATAGMWPDAIHPDDKVRIDKHKHEHDESDGFSETYRIVRPDGTVRWIQDKAFPIKDAAGRVTRVVGVAEDITEHRQLEEQLLRTQRLEAIGTLAGGVAHDLNNILAPTLMATDLLRQSTTDPHGLMLVDMIEQSMKRGAGIIRQMLVFSRGVEGNRTSVQPRHLLHEIETLIRETFPKDIQLEVSVPKDLGMVVADATQLHQVLINLCVNARDAMENGGTLSLTARNVMLAANEVRPGEPGKPGCYVLITVTDTGCGIPKELQDRIFEPFFTTKEVGKGTGLGLSSVLGIVKSHGGFIRVESAHGKGASFNIYIPSQLETPEDASDEVSHTSRPPRGHGELVLIVDDEEIIRETTHGLLEGYGYRVVAAAHGQEALDLFKLHGDAVQLVLTDVMMPVMSGTEFVRKLRAIAPGVPVLASSGLVEYDQRQELAALGVAEVLGKPYGAKILLEAVHRWLPKNPANQNGKLTGS
ncbi:MAG TPA: response regulator [Rariglobus sp.]|jgi:PAS domain S-box-containing protein|nr:response regulator [Rariglobus sp.]